MARVLPFPAAPAGDTSPATRRRRARRPPGGDPFLQKAQALARVSPHHVAVIEELIDRILRDRRARR